ncbi:MAG: hypothetical protein ABIP94_09590 [Planctomycetota bacterium]
MATKRTQEQALDPALAAAWHHVLDVAVGVLELEPWGHIAPDAVLGVHDPVSREVDWCTVMGHAGEVFGIAMYQGDEGYATLHRLEQDAVDELDVQIAQRAVTLTFESAATTTPASKTVLKRLGRKFRGARAWPELLVHEPGLFPIPPWNETQLERIANALCGVAAFVPWAFDDGDGGVCPVPGRAWVTAPPFADGDRRQEVLPAVIEVPVATLPFDQVEVARLRSNSASSSEHWFLDWFCGPSVIDGSEAAGRPFFSTHLMALDLGSGMLLGADVGRLATVAADLLAIVLRLCARQGVPAAIVVRRRELLVALQPLASALGVSLRHEPGLIEVSRNLLSSFLVFGGH